MIWVDYDGQGIEHSNGAVVDLVLANGNVVTDVLAETFRWGNTFGCPSEDIKKFRVVHGSIFLKNEPIIAQGQSITPLNTCNDRYNPIDSRDRIVEIDTMIIGLKKERKELVEKIESEGFNLVKVKEVEEFVLEVGDIVRYARSDYSHTLMQLSSVGIVTLLSVGTNDKKVTIDGSYYVDYRDLDLIAKGAVA